ncbi:MAG TPA: hypothetical protein VIK81_03280 [Patescibacteria group bacterium]
MRNNAWLIQILEDIYKNYFSDVPQVNPIKIQFSRAAKFRFGSIRLVKKGIFQPKGEQTSLILVSGMFKDESIGEDVIKCTIAHELVHYVHGFSSNLPRRFSYPHQGGIINRELRRRGLTNLIVAYKKWLREYRTEVSSS